MKYRNFLLVLFVVLIIVWVGMQFLPKSAGVETTIYLFKGNKLVPAKRIVVGVTTLIPRVALDELLKGPSSEEQQQGYSTQLPATAKVKSLTIENKIASVDFNRELGDYGGGSSRVQGMIAQIVYTLTEFKKIEKVRILVEGNGKPVLGGEGYVIDKPLARTDFSF